MLVHKHIVDIYFKHHIIWVRVSYFKILKYFIVDLFFARKSNKIHADLKNVYYADNI